MANKIGWHVNGTGGNASGIGDALAKQDEAGVRFTVNAVNNGGLAAYAALFDGANHVVVFRKTAWSGEPDYDLPAKEAAAKRWIEILRDMPPEVADVRDRVWIEPTNEPDKNRANWIGYFMLHIARLAHEDGYRIAGPSWATGNPEYEHYETPGMLEWMGYVVANPDHAAFAVHEYSLSANELNRWYPHLLGRFNDYMFAVCDAAGIGRPQTIVTEMGWTLNDRPDSDATAMEHIKWADLAVYGPHPEIMGTCLWTLGSGRQWGDLPAQMERLIVPVTDYVIAEHKDDEPDPRPEHEPDVVKHTIHLLPQNTPNEMTVKLAAFLAPKRTAFTYSHDVVEAVMYHSKPEGTIVAWEPQEWDIDLRERFAWLGVNYEERYFAQIDNPLHGLQLLSPFALPAVVTDYFNARRNYANGLHEGVDIDILNQLADSKEHVLAMVGGDVIRSSHASSGYGHHVVVRSHWLGIEFRLWYCHMDSRLVSVGDTVAVGDALGELGGTGGPWAEHVHINLQVPGHGLSGYYIDDVVNPLPYISLEPQQRGGHDMASFLFPRNGAEFGDIVILKNNWGAGDERQQLQREGPESYVVKNRQWERRFIGPNVVRFEVDTSPGNGEFYIVHSDTGWMPRYWRPGDEFKRVESAVFYRKSDCAKMREFGSASVLRYNAYYDRFTTDGGLVLDGVAEMQWIRNGQVEETYWYARGLGLVQWHNRAGRKSWATELIRRGEQADNERETIGCPQIG